MFLVILFGTILFFCVNGIQLQCSTERKCTCIYRSTFIFANCSGQRLTKTPNFTNDVTQIDFGWNKIKDFPMHLPENLTYLILTGNIRLQKIEASALQRYQKLRHVVISYCNLQYIESGAFSNKSELEHLDISNNPELTLSVLINVTYDIQNSNIRTLLLDRLHCLYGITNVFRTEYIIYLSNTSLETVSIASNRIAFFQPTVLLMLPKTLQALNIGDNNLSFGKYLFLLSSLRMLKILNVTFENKFHPQRNIAYYCKDKRNTYFYPVAVSSTNRLHTHVSVMETRLNKQTAAIGDQNTSLRESITIYLPPNLEKLYFHNNMYKMEINSYHFNTTNRKLTHLFFQNNIFYSLQGRVRGFQSARYLDFSNNLCVEISHKFFDDFDGLLHLNLSRNVLGNCFESDVNGEIFRGLGSMEVLDLSKNQIRNLPRLMFQHMINLSRLFLHYNSLKTFDIVISHMRKLSLIDLSNNQITSLDPPIFASVESLIRGYGQLKINLLQNPLQCGCLDLDFLQRVLRYKDHFLFLSKYNCTSANSTLLHFRDLSNIATYLETYCATYLSLIVVLSLILLVFMSITISSILNRYRWRLRYLYYLAKRRYTEVQHMQNANDDVTYRFDAFISYAEEDREFILNKLNFLEKENGLRICIHCRDFIPGTDIADNITNAIHTSRRTVCVLTPYFVDSYWCMYELNMARMETIYSRKGQNILCLIILEKDVFRKVPFKILDLLENQSYLEYPDKNNDNFAFWDQLCETLKSIPQ
ncbi:toll-like receptor 4 [Magallana gigas]|uniref:toll-like receptor 4 n=1 Tax=Magallana gigas TaxID=29159 RepID=UPI0033424879